MFSKQYYKVLYITFSFSIFIIILSSALSNSGCVSKTPEVVVYVSVDQPFAEPILNLFEKRTGINVKPVFDVEAAKTVGLVNRLRAEKNNPKCDVFWNSEFANTIKLAKEGIIAPYIPINASGIPEIFRDKNGYWTGFAARARVIIVNKNLVKEADYPTSINDFISDKYPHNKLAVCNPFIGTALTHACALRSLHGPEWIKDFFSNLVNKGVNFLDGNAIVKDQVVAGNLLFGLTDTDDVAVALKSYNHVEMIFPDQAEDQIGTLLIPNTVALIANSPNPEEGKKLIEFLVSEEVEKLLAEGDSKQIPVRPHLQHLCLWAKDKNIKYYNINYEKIADEITNTIDELKNIVMK